MFGGRPLHPTIANLFSSSRQSIAIRGDVGDQPVERAATLEDVRAEVLTRISLHTVCWCLLRVAMAIALVRRRRSRLFRQRPHPSSV